MGVGTLGVWKGQRVFCAWRGEPGGSTGYPGMREPGGSTGKGSLVPQAGGMKKGLEQSVRQCLWCWGTAGAALLLPSIVPTAQGPWEAAASRVSLSRH